MGTVVQKSAFKLVQERSEVFKTLVRHSRLGATGGSIVQSPKGGSAVSSPTSSRTHAAPASSLALVEGGSTGDRNDNWQQHLLATQLGTLPATVQNTTDDTQMKPA